LAKNYQFGFVDRRVVSGVAAVRERHCAAASSQQWRRHCSAR